MRMIGFCRIVVEGRPLDGLGAGLKNLKYSTARGFWMPPLRALVE